MLYGVDGLSKLDVVIEIVCLLYLIANETNDWVKVYLIGEKLVSVKKGREKTVFLIFF